MGKRASLEIKVVVTLSLTDMASIIITVSMNCHIVQGACTIRLLTAVIYGLFVLNKPYEPSLMFAGRARGLPKCGAPGANVIKLFTDFRNKLERLSLASLSSLV